MRSLQLSLLTICAALVGAPAFAQGVVINEFSYDDSSIDDREFVELHNASGAPVDISGWVLESQDPSGANTPYSIPPNTILQPGGFYVLGSSVVPNVNQVVGIQDLWENSNETLELRDGPGGNLIDAVAYETWAGPATSSGTWPADIAAQIGEGIWSTFTSIDGYECSWSRNRDGYDTNNNGRDFRQINQSPGATNNLAPVLPVIENFDALTVGADVPGWGNSFVPFRAIDPLQAAGGNPTIITASPQGGNAGLMWDPTGGGDYSTLLTDVAENVIWESWVYFDANPEPSGNYEDWTIGIQGSSDTYGNYAGFAGTSSAANTAYGGTGVCAIYQCTETGGVFYLVDMNDGGWGSGAATSERILGSIPILSGVNDGWQRVRLQAGRDFAELRFSGTFTQPDGTVLSGRITMGSPGGIFLSYRERLDVNGTANPPIVDFLIIRNGTADVEFFGTATPNSVSTPTLAPSAMPTLGDAAYTYELSGLAPNSPAVLLLGFAEFNPPLNLEPLGAPTGSRLYVNSVFGFGLAADANGDASQALGMPNNPSLIGGAVYVQAVNVDVGISAPLPIAHTEALKLTLGN